MSYEVTTKGLPAFEETVSQYPAAARRAAVLAVNDTVRRTRTLAKREIMDQIAWSSRYLGNERSGRLRVSKFATPSDLEARILGRFRPTSLMRFTVNRAQMAVRRGRRGPARVRVSPGDTRTIQRAFLMRLRRGGQLDESNFNYGLAIRLRPGERVENKEQMVPLRPGSNVYLLYGPSVNQVFRGVREDVEPEASRRLAAEYTRQFRRLTRG